jgi:hypothetical protein
MRQLGASSHQNKAARGFAQEETTMLTLTDCLDFIDLDGDTIDVIAEHEQLTAMVAAELGSQLLTDVRGIHRLHQMHRELIAQAAQRHHLEHERQLRRVYTAFNRKYPMPRQM